MKLTLAAAPAEPPVSVEEAKTHLRVEHSDDDEEILALIESATARLDGRDGLLGRALVTQEWVLTLDAFPAGYIELPLPPCQSVEFLTYLDAAGDEQDITDFRAYGLGGSDPVRLYPAAGSSWPETAELPGAVTVEFTAGYGSPEDVPAPIREGIKQAVAARYDGREEYTAAPDPAAMAYRVWAF